MGGIAAVSRLRQWDVRTRLVHAVHAANAANGQPADRVGAPAQPLASLSVCPSIFLPMLRSNGILKETFQISSDAFPTVCPSAVSVWSSVYVRSPQVAIASSDHNSTVKLHEGMPRWRCAGVLICLALIFHHWKNHPMYGCRIGPRVVFCTLNRTRGAELPADRHPRHSGMRSRTLSCRVGHSIRIWQLIIGYSGV
jgi:hypothetical protein